MSVLDNALQTLFKLGVEMEKVWENASPGSNFAPQKIPINLSAVSFLIFTAAAGKSGGSVAEYGIKQAYLITKDTRIFITKPTHFTTPNPLVWSYRSIAISNTGIQFSTGAYKNATAANSTTNDGYAIPLEIYTIKLLGGAIVNLLRRLFHTGRRCAVCQW